MAIRRLLVSFCFLSLPSVALCFLAAEVVFRTLVPATEMPYVYYDPESEVLRFDPMERATGQFTLGKLARHKSVWRVNDHGWIGEVDYEGMRDRQLPIVAIVGDSFVEALHVNVEDNLASVLRRRLRGEANVLSVGISGAPLSQYLQLARHVIAKYDADAVIVNVVQNDLAESIRVFSAKRGCLQVEVTDNSVSELAPIPYSPRPHARVLRKSALVRYLWLNLKIQTLPGRLIRPERRTYVANVEVASLNSHREEIERATRYLIGGIREAVDGRTLLFVMNARRDDVLGTQTGDSLLAWVGELVEDSARNSGAFFLDLTEPFSSLYEETGQPFCFPYDAHWNSHGHRAAALAIESRLREHGFLNRDTVDQASSSQSP